MTREEAINKLVNARYADEFQGDEELTTAHLMAINALEQQPSEDCVSRQTVLAGINDWWGITATSEEPSLCDYIRELPPLIPTQRWIPVSERLPKTDGDYLLFGKVDEDEENYIFVGEYDSCGEQFGIWVEQFDRTTLGCLGSEFYEYASVLAWMPLPEPYKVEMESEE